MEADSTTIDSISNTSEPEFPFPVCPENFKLYKDFSSNSGEGSLDIQIVERLQDFGLLPKSVKCPTAKPKCKVIFIQNKKVIDKVQWVCQACGIRQPIRTYSFFLRLPQCSLLQALQVILAWCEDVDCDASAKHFNVSQRVSHTIYRCMDDLCVREVGGCLLGGAGSVVLVEAYPECAARCSPDTTHQAHAHRILMMADTNHIPTAYRLHVMKDGKKKNSSSSLTSPSVVAEVKKVLSCVMAPESTLVTCGNAPPVEGAVPMHELVQHCDAEMQQFFNLRLWQQAVTLCNASRDLCAGAGGASASAACAGAVQRYLDTALYRLRHADGFYEHALRLLAANGARHTL